MIERTSTDFPQPDSPTIPMASPDASESDTPSTARKEPRDVSNEVFRSRTSSNTPGDAIVCGGLLARGARLPATVLSGTASSPRAVNRQTTA